MIAPLIAAFVAAMVCCKILIFRAAHLFVDEPNERSLHSVPTPRFGGIGILVGILVGWLLVVSQKGMVNEVIFIGAGVILISSISLFDDFFRLSQASRFLVHFCASALMAGGLVYGVAGWGWLVFYTIGTIWMINLYNFMDGMDGFSGGMAFAGFLSLGLAGYFKDVLVFSSLNVIVAAAAAGFLVFNLPPARIFMGDAGSATLGFLAAGFSVWGIRDQVFPLWFPFLVFSPFIVDASVTILRRLFNREKIWLPHRKHFYQRLVLNGWSHRKTVIVEYFLMLACSASAFLIDKHDFAIPGLPVWLAVYIILGILVERKVRARAPFSS
ncbi:MAG: MraY family glycosyltransferase [Candidatus Rifleibacteriota bacterium]